MRLGIIGLPQCGKSTVFGALTGSIVDPGQRAENRLATVHVPDERVDALSRMYRPKKTTYAQMEYFLPGLQARSGEKGSDCNPWVPVRDCEALLHVVRNFGGYGFEKPSPAGDFSRLNQDMILTDQVSVEKRRERLAQEKQRGRKVDPEEVELLDACLAELEAERPLRHRPDLATAHLLRGFAFLSAKPMLVLFNNEDEDDTLPDVSEITASEDSMVIRGKLEQELSQMTTEEAAAFLNEFDIAAPATDRMIAASYALQGLISFFTVGDDEVRAWTIHQGTAALDAAGEIHSDLKQGFIRAEVVTYDDLMAAGSHTEARRQGTVRLEGKRYAVQDGDIVNIRFNI